MIITKPPKPTIVVFTRRSRKKGAKDDSEVEFHRPPPTYEEKAKIVKGWSRHKKLQRTQV